MEKLIKKVVAIIKLELMEDGDVYLNASTLDKFMLLGLLEYGKHLVLTKKPGEPKVIAPMIIPVDFTPRNGEK